MRNSAPPIRIEKNPTIEPIDPILLAAYQAYRAGNYVAAGELYTSVLNKAGGGPSRDALLGMAAVEQQQSNDVLALRYYGQVLTLDPQDPIAHAGLYALLDNSDLEGSEHRLKALLSRHPEAAPLYFTLGNLYARQSRWSEAQQVYFSASALEPDNAEFAFNLAVSLDHLGQRPLSAQYYRRALQLDRADRLSVNTGFDKASIDQRLHQLSGP
ncbi:MAG: tetratricopeptide repeat protein [Pseudomonadota bacterium]